MANKVKVHANLDTLRPRAVKVNLGDNGNIQLKAFGRTVFIQGIEEAQCKLVSFTGKKSKLKDKTLPGIYVETNNQFSETKDGMIFVGGRNIMVIGDDMSKPIAVAVFDLFLPNGIKTAKPLLEIIEYVEQPEKDDE